MALKLLHFPQKFTSNSFMTNLIKFAKTGSISKFGSGGNEIIENHFQN